MGAKPGKAAGHDAHGDHHRQVNQQSRSARHQHRHGHLADAVGNGSQSPRHPELILLQNFPQADGHGNGQGAPGGGIEDGAEIPGEHRPQKNPGGQNQAAVLGSQGVDREHRDDVGKPQLDAGNGNQRRDLRLHQEDGQGNGRQQRQPGDSLCFHSVAAFHALFNGYKITDFAGKVKGKLALPGASWYTDTVF